MYFLTCVVPATSPNVGLPCVRQAGDWLERLLTFYHLFAINHARGVVR